jgi:protein-disulfide isomerase
MRLRAAFVFLFWFVGALAPSAFPGQGAAAPKPSGSSSPALALVAGEPVTEAEVEALISAQLAELRQRDYQLRNQALEELIARRLLDREAKRRGLSVEALIKAEVDAKAVPTDADKKALYEANKARFAGKSEADALKEVEPAARQQKRRERQGEYVRELRSKTQVEVRLEPLRADLRLPATVPSRGGPATAPVTVVEFSDFQCPYCARAQPTLRKLRETYGEKVRFVFADFPLDFHPLAKKAHEAAYCAADQGQFWPMYDRLFASQGKLEVASLKTYATELGLDATAFASCLDSGKNAARAEALLGEGARNGVTGTPAFFINGRMLVGAQPFESFASLIEDELARAARRASAE